MPYVKIQVTNEGLDLDKKKILIKETTEMLQRVLNKNPAETFVLIEEVSTDNWGASGITVTELRQNRKK